MLPSIRIESWDDWTRAYNDVAVWRGLIDAICVRHGIGYQQLEAASANTNAVFLLDRDFAVKIYSPFWEEFELERALLESLRSDDEIPVPELVGSGQISDADGVSWPYTITRFCPARPYSALRDELSEDDAASLAGQLGEVLRALHELDASQFDHAVSERAWADVVSDRRRAVLDELTAAGVLDSAIIGSLESLLDEAIAADLPESRVIVHGDLGADHVLCAPTDEGWQIEALIDFGDAKIGAREYEWMPVWMGFCGRDPSLARRFLETWDPNLLEDPGFPQRAIAWTLLHDFGVDELQRLWRELGQPEPIKSIEALRALLCPPSILR